MFINKIHYLEYDKSLLQKKSPPDYLKKYYQDLYDRYHMRMNIDLSTKTFAFEEMIESLLSKEILESMKTLEHITFTYWGVHWRYIHSAPELYLMHHYQWEGELHDISGCGSLSAYHALRSQLVDAHHNNVAVLSIDNATLLRSGEAIAQPQIDAASALFLARQNTN